MKRTHGLASCPLCSAGEKENVYDFTTADGTNYAFQTVKTLALPNSTYDMRYMDLKDGKTGTVNKDDPRRAASSSPSPTRRSPMTLVPIP